MITCMELSKHTKPGRLGFRYAIEVDLRINTKRKDWRQDYDRRCDSLIRLGTALKKRLGKSYQPRWTRKQLNRKWYNYAVDRNRKIRICFLTERERTLAMMMFS